MNFLLDTSVVSEAMRKQPNARVLNWIAAQIEESLFISAITVGELRRGSLVLGDGKKRKALLRWIETGIKAEFAGRILPVDSAVMEALGGPRSLDRESGPTPAGNGQFARRHRPCTRPHTRHAQHSRLRGCGRAAP